MSLKRLLDMFPAAQSTVLLQTSLPIVDHRSCKRSALHLDVNKMFDAFFEYN